MFSPSVKTGDWRLHTNTNKKVGGGARGEGGEEAGKRSEWRASESRELRESRNACRWKMKPDAFMLAFFFFGAGQDIRDFI